MPWNTAFQTNWKFWFKKKISNEARFERITNLDDRKNKLCVENGLNLFYYTEEKIDNYRYEIYKNLDLLLEKILSLSKIN